MIVFTVTKPLPGFCVPPQDRQVLVDVEDLDFGFLQSGGSKKDTITLTNRTNAKVGTKTILLRTRVNTDRQIYICSYSRRRTRPISLWRVSYTCYPM